MMPWMMIAFVTIGASMPPQLIEIEFADADACLAAGGNINKSAVAVGFCIDRYTGETVAWMTADDEGGKTPLERLPRPDEQ
jgi:hypothetical protein